MRFTIAGDVIGVVLRPVGVSGEKWMRACSFHVEKVCDWDVVPRAGDRVKLTAKWDVGVEALEFDAEGRMVVALELGARVPVESMIDPDAPGEPDFAAAFGAALEAGGWTVGGEMTGWAAD